MAASSTLEIILQLKDEASAALSNFASSSGETFKNIGEQAKSIGEPMAAVGAVMTAVTGYAVAQAASVQEASTKLESTFTNQIANATAAKDAHSALATEITFVTDKLNNLEAENNKLAASHEKTAAGAAKVTAQMAVNSDAINKLKEQLSGLSGQLNMTGQNAEALVKQFEDVAAANTSLGFSSADSIESLNMLERVIGNPTEALQAYQDAMDLARARGEDLNTSTTQVIQGFNGMGKSLQMIGVNVKDGLAGMEALNAISQQVGGSAAKSVGDFNVQTEVLHAKLQLAAADLGQTLLPVLTSFIETVNDAVTNIIAWTQAHPDLTHAITIVAASLGALLLVVGSAITTFGFLASSIGAIATVFGVTAGAVIAAVGWIVGAIVAAAVIVTLIITYHTQITTAITNAWNAIVAYLTGVWNGIKTFFASIWQGFLDIVNTIGSDISNAIQLYADFWVGLIITALNYFFPQWQQFFTNLFNTLKKAWSDITTTTQAVFSSISGYIQDTLNIISGVWNNTWNGIASYFSSIWQGIKGTIASAISYIGTLIDQLVNKVNSVLGAVLGPIQSVGSALASAANVAGSGISNFVGGVIDTGASAIAHLATGGVVNGPTFALIGEDGPEAVIPLSSMGKGNISPLGSIGGAGGNGVVININGGTYLDANVAIDIANQIAKVVGQQLKLRTT